MSTDLAQFVPLPKTSLPIVIFGAGSIVTDAHLPAYARLGFTVAGIYDPDHAKATVVAAKHGTRAFATVAVAVLPKQPLLALARSMTLPRPPPRIRACLRRCRMVPSASCKNRWGPIWPRPTGSSASAARRG